MSEIIRFVSLCLFWAREGSAGRRDAGSKLETKAALISVGAFALLAGGATFGYAHLAKVLPAWRDGLSTPILTTITHHLVLQPTTSVPS